MHIGVGAIKRLCFITLGLVFLSFNTSAYAQEVYGQLDTPFYDPGDTGLSCNLSTSGGSLPATIPTVWRSLIENTASKYPTADARLVAAVLWVENRGWPEYKTSGWGVSSAGAKGPWQFIDSTWASMGTDGDGDGRKDQDNPKDSVHAAFKHHLGSAGKPIASVGYSGNPDADFNTVVYTKDFNNLLHFAGKYNGSGAPEGVKLKDFPRGQNSDYVIMSYWLLATNFSKAYHIESGKFIELGKTDQAGCGDIGGGSVNTAGYSFPVAPQRKSQNGGAPAMSALPCNSTTCHHDGTPAFDISRKPGGKTAAVGTPVYAIMDGTIKRINNAYDNIQGCQSLQLAAKDGYWYWYGHLQSVKVKLNQQVSAGQQLAVIGASKCAKGSDPHLHIDRGLPKGKEGGMECCREPGMIGLINSLFNELPE